jgi:phosphomannomutase
MSLAFGTSGIRGLAAEMTDRQCVLYTTAFLRHLEARGWRGPVLLAGDLRASTPRILQAVAYGLQQAGREVRYCGLIPTPALAHAAIGESLASIMVTGSHIAADRNGIKFNLPVGEVLKDDEREIARLYGQLRQVPPTEGFDSSGMLASHLRPRLGVPDPQAAAAYLRRYLTFFPPGSLAGLKLAVYQHSSVSRDLLPEILQGLGAEVRTMGRSERFLAVDTEAVENPRRLAAWVRGHDALVSTDGDGDRPLLVDGRGALVPGDLLGILAARFLEADSVSVPVSCNTAVEASRWFVDVRRTRIGSPYVIASMNEALRAGSGRVVGFEGNGGFLTASPMPGRFGGPPLAALPTRDAVLPLVCVLCEAQRRGLPVRQLVAGLPPRRTATGLLRRVPPEAAEAILEELGREDGLTIRRRFGRHFGAVAAVDRTDGLRMRFSQGTVVHLRRSGNAPEFRVYVETGSAGASQRALRRALSITARMLRATGRT